jgi:hypothetical protein
MVEGVKSEGLVLTEEEAFSLLGLCLTSSLKLDGTSELALRKLAAYCSESNYYLEPHSRSLACELR